LTAPPTPDLVEVANRTSHVVGRITAEPAGPTVIAMVGIHGNEPSGLRAARRVLETIENAGILKGGEFVVLAGNLEALEKRQRFIDRDLNRQWTPQKIRQLRAGTGPQDAEANQQRELLEEFERIIEAARGPIHFLDLHTSSAEGPPFLTVGDTLRNRAFAENLPLPLILGLEEQVDGSLLEYLNNFGFVTLGVEAGQHDSEESVDRHEAVLWLALEAADMFVPNRTPELGPYRRMLRRASTGIPRVVEVRHRHAITPADEFRMDPGHVNFGAVSKGQAIACDRLGPITVPENGMMLLPLYQGQGDDGFFVARQVRAAWLRVSSALRRLKVDWLIPSLPGVRRGGERDVLIVDTRIARLYPLEIFHLFGFRKLRTSGDELLVSRRRYDLTPPRETTITY
jgi:succinylglutamate desuccinylase